MESVTKQPWQNVAQIELVYRTKIKASERPKVNSSKEIADLLKGLWDENKIDFVEQFKVLLLNRANRVLGIVEIGLGSSTGVVADLKVVLAAAILANACNIIIAHNHPSGSIRPSRADEQLTNKLKEAAKLHDINVMDHVIVTSEEYYSFADEGLL